MTFPKFLFCLLQLCLYPEYMTIKFCFHLMRDKRFPQSPWGRRVAFVPLLPLLPETISVWKYQAASNIFLPQTYSIWTQNIQTYTSSLPLPNITMYFGTYCLLAPTGALILLMCYYSIRSAAATFLNFKHFCQYIYSFSF